MAPDLHADLPLPEPPSLEGAVAPARPTRWAGLARFLLLAALAALPYVNSLRNGFVYDDADQVLANPYIRNFQHLREIFTSSVWSYMGDFRSATNYYRPLMTLGYLVCYRLFGLRAFGFHLASLLANVGVVFILFLLTRRMFHSERVAVLTATIFALHPIHTEAVDWIAAVTELELAIFYLLTFWLFLGSVRPGGKWSVLGQIGMAGSFVGAMLSKEQALTLPLLATLYEHLVREDRAETSWVRKLSRYGVLWLLSGAYLVVRARFLGGLVPSQQRTDFGPAGVVVSAGALLAQYFWKLLWPARLCAYYEFPNEIALLLPWMLGGCVVLALCAWGFEALGRASRPAAFGVVWFLATLAPVLNVHWMANNVFTERYLYLSSVGFCWILGWAGARLWAVLAVRNKGWRAALLAVACLTGALSVIRIVKRNRDWRDNETLYTSTLVISPDAFYIHNNLGTVYWGRGDWKGAEKEWREALRLAPNNEYVLHNLGLLAREEKQYEEAVGFFLRALQVKPNYMDAHLNLGKTYAAMGRVQEAELQLRDAAVLSPLSVWAHNALGEFYLDQRRLSEAEEQFRRSLEIEPTREGNWDLGLVHWLRGDREEAERAFKTAEALSPSSSRAHFMLGLLYSDSGRTADAIREYRTGLQFDPTNPEALATLKKLESQAPHAQQ
jgi:tetratricopeptide (TPR) repeat protein